MPIAEHTLPLETLHGLESHFGAVNIKGVILDGKGLNSKFLGIDTWALPVALQVEAHANLYKQVAWATTAVPLPPVDQHTFGITTSADSTNESSSNGCTKKFVFFWFSKHHTRLKPLRQHKQNRHQLPHQLHHRRLY